MTILRNSLMTLEAYAKERKAMRERVIEHKKIVLYVSVIMWRCYSRMR
jgi:hypothetical protein